MIISDSHYYAKDHPLTSNHYYYDARGDHPENHYDARDIILRIIIILLEILIVYNELALDHIQRA